MKMFQLRNIPAVLICIFFLLICFPSSSISGQTAETLPGGVKQSHSAAASEETFKYSITWLGIKVGELLMETKIHDPAQDQYAINVTIRAANVFSLVYPGEDTFVTIVEGADRLPVRYSSDRYKSHDQRRKKEIVYDQVMGQVIITEDENLPETVKVEGPVHNEFSSFIALRTLAFNPGGPVIVPTFADKKRYAVEVTATRGEKLETIFGEVGVVRVTPKLTFKGLYKKKSAPVIWLTDDTLRVPVRIKAKITLGSLTANLVEYQRS